MNRTVKYQRAWRTGRRLGASLTTLALGAGLLAACGSSSTSTSGSAKADDEGATIVVGHTKDLSNAPFYIARDRGYFKDAGVSVKDQIITTGATGMSLAATGKLDVLQAGLAAGYFNGVKQGLDLTIIGGGNVFPEGDAAPGGLLVRKSLVDSGAVKSVADLRGMKVALPGGPGAALSYPTAAVLSQGGLGLSDIKGVNVDPANLPAAFKSGAVDAGIGVEPFASQAIQQKVATAFAKVPPGVGVAAMMANTGFLKSHTKELTAFYSAMQRAACDLRPQLIHDPKNVALLASALGMSPDAVRAIPSYAYDLSPSPKNVGAMQDLWLKTGQLSYDKSLPMSDLIDDSIAQGYKGTCPPVSAGIAGN